MKKKCPFNAVTRTVNVTIHLQISYNFRLQGHGLQTSSVCSDVSRHHTPQQDSPHPYLQEVSDTIP